MVLNKNVLNKICGMILITIIFLFAFTSLNSISKEKIKYYKNIDKTHYYTEFVNEVPYFLVNRYDYYYEVLYDGESGKITEVTVYENRNIVEKWFYSYPEKGIVEISYKYFYNINPPDDIVNKDDIIYSDIKYIDRLYYDMGRLTKKENYDKDHKMNYYFTIDYENDKITNEYYFNSDNSYVYKYFFYDSKGDITRVIRKGETIKDNKKISISERWNYRENRLYNIENYKNNNLYSIYYFDEYGSIIKKELLNKMLRVYKYYKYDYTDDLELEKITIYDKAIGTNNQTSSDIIISEYEIFYKNNQIKNTLYENKDGSINETTYDFDNNLKILKTYNSKGNITNVSYTNIDDRFEYTYEYLNTLINISYNASNSELYSSKTNKSGESDEIENIIINTAKGTVNVISNTTDTDYNFTNKIFYKEFTENDNDSKIIDLSVDINTSVITINEYINDTIHRKISYNYDTGKVEKFTYDKSEELVSSEVSLILDKETLIESNNPSNEIIMLPPDK